MRKPVLYAGVIVLILAIVGVGLLFNSHLNSNNVSTPTNSAQSVAATIEYTDSGFSPASVSVKAGDTVAFTNKSSKALEVNSDPHPIHTDDQDLNVGRVGSGQTRTAVLTKTGSFGIHNHLYPKDESSITIK